VIHRDLKPANIFIVQRKNTPPVIKVLDFGIAKLAAEALDEDEHQALTQVGAMIGTPRYMSPEQCDGAKLTPAADVYSLGIILYELLTGVTPFNGTTPLAVALKHSSLAPQPLTELVASIPKPLEELVLHALAKKPEERPADAGEFRRELYDVAQRLGLEHAAGFTAPTFEALRNAGNETPSGRLVIDIERLRESRAVSNRNTGPVSAVDTEEDRSSPVADSQIVNSPVADSPLASPTVAQSAVSPSSLAFNTAAALEPDAPLVEASESSARPISRFKVSLNQKPSGPGLFQRPLVLFGLGVGTLLLAAAVFGLVTTRTTSSGQLVVVEKGSETMNQLVAQSKESVMAEGEQDNGASGRQTGRAGARESRRAGGGVVRLPPPTQNKPSKIGSLVNKVKKIFKNPF
jgi:serine/threonine protein kinase